MTNIKLAVFDLDQTLWDGRKLYPDVQNILASLHLLGVKMYIASYNENPLYCCQLMNIAHYFQKYYYGLGRPKSQMIREIIEENPNITQNEVAFFDDQEFNILDVKKNLAIIAVKVLNGLGWNHVNNLISYDKWDNEVSLLGPLLDNKHSVNAPTTYPNHQNQTESYGAFVKDEEHSNNALSATLQEILSDTNSHVNTINYTPLITPKAANLDSRACPRIDDKLTYRNSAYNYSRSPKYITGNILKNNNVCNEEDLTEPDEEGPLADLMIIDAIESSIIIIQPNGRIIHCHNEN